MLSISLAMIAWLIDSTAVVMIGSLLSISAMIALRMSPFSVSLIGASLTLTFRHDHYTIVLLDTT